MPALSSRSIITGARCIAHVFTQAPQPIHCSSSPSQVSDSTRKVTPLVPFATGKAVELMAKPIIGPPEIHLTASPFTLNTEPSRSLIKVPTGTRMLQGLSTPPPLIVRARSIRGLPRRKASLIAHTVPTLEMIQPASAGNFALGISTPRQAETMNFSEP